MDLAALLDRTSRTFALSIPLLPEPTRQEVLLAYLLFRIADTFEDSTAWTRERRIEALDDFAKLLADPDPDHAEGLGRAWSRGEPIDHTGYQELLAETGRVIDAYRRLSPAAQDAIRYHVTRTCEGMAGYVRRADEKGRLGLDGVDELRRYCYVVAGIVGEMLTDLFLLDREQLSDIREELTSRARFFGEGLQLTNILKDSSTDAEEGRSYIGPSVDRAEVFRLAREDLDLAAQYTLVLQRSGAERGLVAFNALPVLLATATLDTVERDGPGSKITREQLWSIVAEMNRALDVGEPVIRSPESTLSG